MGYLQFLAILNKFTMNIVKLCSCGTLKCHLGMWSRAVYLDPELDQVPNFRGTWILISVVGTKLFTPTSSAFSTAWTITCVIDLGHSSTCKRNIFFFFFFYYYFSRFFVYILKAFPFPSSPHTICPISPLPIPSSYSPI